MVRLHRYPHMINGIENPTLSSSGEKLLQPHQVLNLIAVVLPQLQEAFADTILAPYFSQTEPVETPTAVHRGRKAVYAAHKTMDDYGIEISLDIAYLQKRNDDIVEESLRFKFPKAGNFLPEAEHAFTAYDGAREVKLNTAKADRKIRSVVNKMKKAK
jgi:hypothetical protein